MKCPCLNFRTKSQAMTLCAGTACPCVVRTIKIPLLWRAIKNLSWTPRDTTSLNYPMHYLCTVVEIGFEGCPKKIQRKTPSKKGFNILFFNTFWFRHFFKWSKHKLLFEVGEKMTFRIKNLFLVCPKQIIKYNQFC